MRIQRNVGIHYFCLPSSSSPYFRNKYQINTTDDNYLHSFQAGTISCACIIFTQSCFYCFWTVRKVESISLLAFFFLLPIHFDSIVCFFFSSHFALVSPFVSLMSYGWCDGMASSASHIALTFRETRQLKSVAFRASSYAHTHSHTLCICIRFLGFFFFKLRTQRIYFHSRKTINSRTIERYF